MTDTDYEAVRHLREQVAALTRERDVLRAALEEREHDMHMRIRAGYDKTVADAWRARVEELEGALSYLLKEALSPTDDGGAFDNACKHARSVLGNAGKEGGAP